MRHALFTISMVVFAATLSAQQSKVIGAWKNLNDYYTYKEISSLNKAKESIDLASENPDTKAEAKTWNYRGKIYQAIFEHNREVETEKLKDITDENKKNSTAYLNTPIAELEMASAAYSRSRELDVKKTYFQENTQKLGECSKHFENKGISLYVVKQYSEALPAFEKAIDIGTILGEIDSTNINNAALAAERAKDFGKAKTYYQKLTDLKYGKGLTYATLAGVYQNLGDTAMAYNTVKKGRLAYPDDADLMIAEINFNLHQGKTAEAINNLKLAIQKRPKDENLYLVLGDLYSAMANPKDNAGKDLEKPKNYDELFAHAEENYKKAMELKPDFFNAYFNLGVLYNNRAWGIAKKANTIKDQAQYAAEDAKANEEFRKALPYFEKARTINGNDRNLLIALKQLYARTNQPEKLKEVDALLKN